MIDWQGRVIDIYGYLELERVVVRTDSGGVRSVPIGMFEPGFGQYRVGDRVTYCAATARLSKATQ